MIFTSFSGSRKFVRVGHGVSNNINMLTKMRVTVAHSRTFSNIVPFKLADIGEGIAEVELMKWFVRKGDTVKSFDRLCEVQSDKATVEITSRYNGVIAEIYHEEGAIVKVGESLVDIEVEKSATPVAKPSSDTIVNAKIEHAGTGNAPSKRFSDESFNTESEKIQTTPAVRKIAKENGINLASVRGTGPKGRILKEDLLGMVVGSRTSGLQPASPFAAKPHQAPQDIPSPMVDSHLSNKLPLSSHGDQKVPVRGVQRLMVKTMTAANKVYCKNGTEIIITIERHVEGVFCSFLLLLKVPHLTLGEEVNFTKMIEVRKDLKKSFESLGVKLSYLPFILKATSLALLEFPALNATVNDDVTEVTHHHSHNIGTT